MRPLRWLASLLLAGLASPSQADVSQSELPFLERSHWPSIDKVGLDPWFRSNVDIVNPGLKIIYPLLQLKHSYPEFAIRSAATTSTGCSSPLSFGFYEQERGKNYISFCQKTFHELIFYLEQSGAATVMNKALLSQEEEAEYHRDLFGFFAAQHVGRRTNVNPCPIEFYAYLRRQNIDSSRCFANSAVPAEYITAFLKTPNFYSLDKLKSGPFYDESQLTGSTDKERMEHVRAMLWTGGIFGAFYHVYFHEVAHLFLRHEMTQGCLSLVQEKEADDLAQKITDFLEARSYVNQYGAYSEGVKFYNGLALSAVADQLGAIESDEDLTEDAKRAIQSIAAVRYLETIGKMAKEPEFMTYLESLEGFDRQGLDDMASGMSEMLQCSE